MITKISVNGFKSLSNFDLKLQAGLNILVGPNGSGKTNIILFFEFLSQLMSNQIGHAVSAVGGAGTIFKKVGLNDYNKDIEFKIFGSKRLEGKDVLTYEFEAKITTSFEKDSIFYSYQRVKIKTGKRFCEDPDDIKYANIDWDLDISYVQDANKPVVTVNTLKKDKVRSRFLKEDKDNNFGETTASYVRESNPSVKNIITSLFPLADDLAYNVFIDLVGGETFNVVPSKVKELEDAATPPGIKKDGSGLATTLYAMKNSKTKKELNFVPFHFFFDHTERTFDPNTLKKIVSYLKLANKTIKNLDVANDPFNNKLVVKIQIDTGGYKSVLPLSAMSDGTIKWLALITAILTSKTIFSIEEPENFLHPWMQAEIANIMREHIEGKEQESFVLMTTHSESLLNHSQPNEILLVSLENGQTVAKRLGNLELIAQEISRSGFGLGHFYFSDALQ